MKKKPFVFCCVFVISFVLVCFGAVRALEYFKIYPSKPKLIGDIKAARGQEQADLIFKNSWYLCENLPAGIDKQSVLDILGPPMNPVDDPVWFYPRPKPGKTNAPSFYCMIKDGKLARFINKTAGVNFAEDYRYTRPSALFNKEEYDQMLAAVDKYCREPDQEQDDVDSMNK